MNFLKSKIFRKIIYLIIGLGILNLIYFTYIFRPNIEKNIVGLENSIGKIQLQKIQKIIQTSATDLKVYEKMALQSKKDELKVLTSIALAIIDAKFKASTPQNTKQTKDEVLELLKQIKYANDDYFFVSDYESVLISHPYLRDADFKQTTDIYGNLIVPPMVEIAREKGEGFTSYWWKKNSSDDAIFEKLSFVKNYPPWGWVVGTGVYVDDIAAEVKKRKENLIASLKETLLSTKIGKSGYVYIFDDASRIIIHPNKELEGVDASKLINPTKNNSYILDDLMRAYKTGDKKYNYLWDKPGDIGNFSYEKISWIAYDPYFKWYIVSSGYVEEFYESSADVDEFIFYADLFITFVLIVIGILFFKNLLKPILKLAEYARVVKNGNLAIRYDEKIQDDETGVLATQFNEMLDTIQYQIKTLDSKVEEKTHALSFALTQKEILLREVQHRVKNNLNVINSIVGLQVFQDKQPSLESFITTLQHRINSMSLAHELLSKSKNTDRVEVKNYMTTLVSSLVEAYTNPTECVFEYEIDEIELKIDKLLSCGLIVNELVTNSIKHAFKATDNYIYLSIKQSDETITLQLKDSGDGFDGTLECGIGLELVKTLVSQLKGTIVFSADRKDTITINFKI